MSFTHNAATVPRRAGPTIAGQPAQIPRTRVVARFSRGIPFRLELAPFVRPAPPQPPKGTRPVKLGDQEFDREFVVQANDLEMTRDFLGPAVRGAITNLHRSVHPGGMLVSINPERMLVQIDRDLGAHSESLAWAVQETLALHDALIEGVSRRMKQGIDIVDDSGAVDEDLGPPICKVCGEPISGGVVIVCAACNTPHHRDCWDYVGACSIYGCDGKVGVREYDQRRYHLTTREDFMSSLRRRHLVLLCVLLAGLSFAFAASRGPSKLSSIGQGPSPGGRQPISGDLVVLSAGPHRLVSGLRLVAPDPRLPA